LKTMSFLFSLVKTDFSLPTRDEIEEITVKINSTIKDDLCAQALSKTTHFHFAPSTTTLMLTC